MTVRVFALENVDMAFHRLTATAELLECTVDAKLSDPGDVAAFYALAAAIRHFSAEGVAALRKAEQDRSQG